MTSKGAVYGIVVAAIALILITATFAGYYYFQYSSSDSNNSQLTAELNTANANYSSLASNFNLLLTKYNQSISLLSNAIAVMNTSLPAYSQAAAQLNLLWSVYQSLNPASKSLLHDSVYFDFGNGTREWYNGTAINAGWNLYIETVVLLKGQVIGTWYPSYGEHFITGLGGVSNSASEYWFLWTYSNTTSWQVAQVGADDILATSGSVYAWTYCGAAANFSPTCSP
jgi:hypothetical protein